MVRLRLSLCLAAALLAPPAFAATANSISTDDSASIGNRPVAYVYVSDSYTRTFAFSVAKNGRLTPVPGSPFKADIGDMAVSKKYLFATEYFAMNIDTYVIAHDGSLHFLRSLDAGVHNPGGCGAVQSLSLDRTRSTLYAGTLDPTCFDDQYQAYKLHFPTGGLHYLDTTPGFGLAGAGKLTFMGNNSHAYQADCTFFDHEEVGFLQGVERHLDGTLTMLNLGPLPPTPEPNNVYCPLNVTADHNGYLLAMLEDEDVDGDVYGANLMTFSVDANGNLTSTGTGTQMDQAWYSISMSPSGKLVAVGGSAGLKVYNFHGSNPLTPYATLVASSDVPASGAVNPVSWDDNDHLFAIENRGWGKKSKLFVFNVTSEHWSQAPGSPYTIGSPVSFGVHPNHPDSDNDFDGD